APVHVAVLWDGDVIRAGALSLTFRLPARLPTVAPEPVFTPPAPVIPAQPYLGSTMALTRPVPHLDWSQAAPHAPVEQATITTAPPPSKIQPRIELLKSEQDFNSAFFAALISVVLGGAVYVFGRDLPWPFFLPVIAATGLGIGGFVRAAGKGIEPRFGHLAGVAGITAVLAASAITSQFGVAEHHLVKTDTATVESRSFSTEAEPSPLASRPALFDPTALDQPDPGVQLKAPASPAPLPEAPPPPLTGMEALGSQLFAPRALLASLLIGSIAWRTAFRRLTLDEVSDHHRPVTASESAALTLRDRVRIGLGKETPRA
ncbi:MAG: hypothetical protein JNG86_13725, partial [Verrucomicrobiaceae bacterium]|nr:hypothetical protein [Verrucomicrobiaceae bacterium]